MLKAVLDTNVLVSVLWSPEGNASTIVRLLLSDKVILCLDQQIIDEYKDVLSRPRLAFPPGQVEELLAELANRSLSVIVPSSTVKMPDEADRKFYDVAAYCGAYLVTGNIRHFPKDPIITTPAQFLAIYKTHIS